MSGTEETHLRSTVEVNGYAIATLDGFIIDTQYWVIRYLEIDTHSWWPGKHVLVNPGWIEEVSWAERTVLVGLTHEVIKRTPGFDPSKVNGREYETQLIKYYESPGYWRLGNSSD